jgi:FKBP-type peptidyl-prolyl cis-trans isomerase (trigger factor)
MNKNYTLAKSDDGTIQITYTIPYSEIEDAKKKAAEDLGKEIEIAGFRKGMAPIEKVIEKIPHQTLIENALQIILPKYFAKTIEQEDLKPIVYPKFNIIKADDQEDWQITATTAEMPEFPLGDYKSAIKGSTAKIWKPGDSNQDSPKTYEQKEQAVISALLSTSNVKIPRMLIEEEVDARLSRLLEQVDRLGLTLQSYLSSIGKKIEDIRSEYEKQAEQAITLDFILAKISHQEGISVTNEEVDEAIKISINSDPSLQKEFDSPQKRRLVESILIKRKTLNQLVSLVGS